MHLDGVNRRYQGLLKVGLFGLVGLGLGFWRLDRMVKGVPSAEPWKARGARKLDAKTLGAWFSSPWNVLSATARKLLNATMTTLFCVDPTEVSSNGVDWQEKKAEITREIRILSDYLHSHVLRINGHNSDAQILVSARELDCLKWTAAGKTAWEGERHPRHQRADRQVPPQCGAREARLRNDYASRGQGHHPASDRRIKLR